MKDLFTKRLSEDVRDLIIRGHMVASNALMLNLITDAMDSKVKVLGQLSNATLLGNSNGSFVIYSKNGSTNDSRMKFGKQVANERVLFRSSGSCTVLSQSRGVCNNIELTRRPSDRATRKKHNVATRGLRHRPSAVRETTKSML